MTRISRKSEHRRATVQFDSSGPSWILGRSGEWGERSAKHELSFTEEVGQRYHAFRIVFDMRRASPLSTIFTRFLIWWRGMR